MKSCFKPLLTLLAAFVFCQLGEVSAFADVPVEVGDKIRVYDGPGDLGGGIFDIKPLAGADFTPFQTFCLQRTESIDFASKGFIVQKIGTKTDAGDDPLSPKTAWLYTQFRLGIAGALDELGFAFAGATAANSANALQSAIWYIEDEPGYGSLDALPGAYRNLAKALVSAATAAGWTDLGNVRIANLVYSTERSGHKAGDKAQDILILVPEPASIAFWSTSAVLGGVICSVRRRRTSGAAV